MTQVHVVTGASGFIGRSLCRALESQAEVVGVSRAGVPDGLVGRWTSHDLDSGEPAFPNGIDTCFHLAGRAHAVADTQDLDPLYRLTNVEGTRRAIDAAATAHARAFVLFSSTKVFGDSQQLADRGLSEDDDPEPDTPYGKSKLDAEQLVLSDSRIPHRVVIRPSLVYGPGVKGNLARMREAVGRGWFPAMRDTGNRRSLVHVNDVVSLALLAANEPSASGRVFHAADGELYSTRRLYVAMCVACGRQPAEWPVPDVVLRTAALAGDAAGVVMRRRAPFDTSALRRLRESAWFAADRARGELGWKPLNTVESWCRSEGAG